MSLSIADIDGSIRHGICKTSPFLVLANLAYLQAEARGTPNRCGIAGALKDSLADGLHQAGDGPDLAALIHALVCGHVLHDHDTNHVVLQMLVTNLRTAVKYARPD
eukprot:SAG11_NODE_4495_length_1875_cov_0.964527_1_plen_106_part_00